MSDIDDALEILKKEMRKEATEGESALLKVSRSILGEPKRPPELDLITSLYLIISSRRTSERISITTDRLYRATRNLVVVTLILVLVNFLLVLVNFLQWVF